jgi:hypothetical protein
MTVLIHPKNEKFAEKIRRGNCQSKDEKGNKRLPRRQGTNEGRARAPEICLLVEPAPVERVGLRRVIKNAVIKESHPFLRRRRHISPPCFCFSLFGLVWFFWAPLGAKKEQRPL